LFRLAAIGGASTVMRAKFSRTRYYSEALEIIHINKLRLEKAIMKLIKKCVIVIALSIFVSAVIGCRKNNATTDGDESQLPVASAAPSEPQENTPTDSQSHEQNAMETYYSEPLGITIEYPISLKEHIEFVEAPEEGDEFYPHSGRIIIYTIPKPLNLEYTGCVGTIDRFSRALWDNEYKEGGSLAWLPATVLNRNNDWIIIFDNLTEIDEDETTLEISNEISDSFLNGEVNVYFHEEQLP